MPASKLESRMDDEDAVSRALRSYTREGPMGPLGDFQEQLCEGQQPTLFFVPGLEPTQAWWPPSALGRCLGKLLHEELEKEWPVLRHEMNRLRQHSAATPQQVTGKGISGDWQQFHLLEKGNWHEVHCQICPRTAHLLRGLGHGHGGSVCESRLGSVRFDVLAPGSTIPPHFGPSNVTLRGHLPLSVPEDGSCGIMLHGTERPWRQGEMLLFDSSFLHSLWNESGGVVVVLVFDVWHPSLAPEQIAEIASSCAFMPPRVPSTVSVMVLQNVALYAVIAQHLAHLDLARTALVCHTWWEAQQEEAYWVGLICSFAKTGRFRSRVKIQAPPEKTEPAGQAAPVDHRSMRDVYLDLLDESSLHRWLREDGTEMVSHDEESRWAKRQMDPYKIYKFYVFGDRGVGKTALLTRFEEGFFQERYLPSIGLDLKFCNIGFNEENLKLQLYDCSREVQYRLPPKAWGAAHAVVVLYDITKVLPDDITEGYWLDCLDKIQNGCCVCILGCKLDLDSQRQVTYKQGRALADKWSAALGSTVLFGECSAKTGEGVEAIMARILRRVQKRHQQQMDTEQQLVAQSPRKQCLIS